MRPFTLVKSKIFKIENNQALALVLSICLCLYTIVSLPVASFADTDLDYSGHWAEEQINAALEAGYMTALSDSATSYSESIVFGPELDMTRSMMVSALYIIACEYQALYPPENAEDDDTEGDDTGQIPMDGDADDNISIGEGSDNQLPVDDDEDRVAFGLSYDIMVIESDVDGNSEEDFDDSEDPEAELIPVDCLADPIARFSDMDGSEPYADAVRWAVESGIVQGANGCFMPDLPLNRETTAVLMARFTDYLGVDLDEDWSVMLEYDDLEFISDWAVEGIAYCAMTGLMSGNADGTFAPKATLTRAQGAVIVVRLAGRLLVLPESDLPEPMAEEIVGDQSPQVVA